jgi:hypothetical protein
MCYTEYMRCVVMLGVILLNFVMLKVIILCVVMPIDDVSFNQMKLRIKSLSNYLCCGDCRAFRYAECHRTEWHFADCRYVE